MEFIKSEPGADPIVVEAYLDRLPAVVYRAWTEPEIVKRWFGRAPNTLVSATIDLRVGGRWCFLEHEAGTESSGFEGEYLALEPDQRLVFSWVKFNYSNGVRTKTQPSQVDIRLSATGKGTKLVVTHSGIVDDEMRHGFAGGWARGIAGMRAIFS